MVVMFSQYFFSFAGTRVGVSRGGALETFSLARHHFGFLLAVYLFSKPFLIFLAQKEECH